MVDRLLLPSFRVEIGGEIVVVGDLVVAPVVARRADNAVIEEALASDMTVLQLRRWALGAVSHILLGRGLEDFAAFT